MPSASTAHEILQFRKVLATTSRLSDSDTIVRGLRCNDPSGVLRPRARDSLIFAMVEVVLPDE